MTKTKVKICGLRHMEDVIYANECMPDYIGFILADGFWRQITSSQVKLLSQKLHPDIKRVGVFVNQPIDVVLDYVKKDYIHLVQLHGQEDDEYIRSLRQQCRAMGKTPDIIKAFRIKEREDIELAKASEADYLLLDAWSKEAVGGTGTTFDWNLIQNINRPYFLAGGLDATNVAKAIERLHPYAVDASSSLETDRKKDSRKMKAFVNAIRSYENMEERK